MKRLTERFFSRDTIYWTEKFGSLSLDESRELNVEQSLTQSLYWDSINECSVDGSEFGEGIGAYIDGNIKARFEYGFSLGVSSVSKLHSPVPQSKKDINDPNYVRP